MIKLPENSNAANLHFLVIENELRKRIKKVAEKGLKIDGLDVLPCGVFRRLLEWLLIGNNLENIITASPIRLLKIIKWMNKMFPEVIDPNSTTNYVLYNIFVSSIYENVNRFDKMEFIQRIEMDTCSYCNRNYTYCVEEDREVKPQIDHFFPKDKYPYLGVSFYNLIPSCELCNGPQGKHNKDPQLEGLVNPYLLGTDDFKITYDILSSNVLNSLLDRSSIKIRFDKKIAGHLNVFNLKGLYEKHADHVLELIIKSQVSYSPEYRTYLKSFSKKGLVLSDNEIDRMILGNYSLKKEVHLRPLAKLYQDIGLELGLIK